MRIEWWEIDQVGKLDQLLYPTSKWRSRTGFWILAKVTLVAVGRMDWRELDQEHRVQKGGWSLSKRWRRPPARKGCKQALMVQNNTRRWLSERRQKVKGKSLDVSFGCLGCLGKQSCTQLDSIGLDKSNLRCLWKDCMEVFNRKWKWKPTLLERGVNCYSHLIKLFSIIYSNQTYVCSVTQQLHSRYLTEISAEDLYKNVYSSFYLIIAKK